jgi:UDP-N-acetylmuramate: L-alanyl-gamma-D-glutamyl-meso-diaminopimelate ligase
MGAVAAAMRDRGYVVTGQDDNVYPPMSTFLDEKSIAITQGFRAEDIPGADLVVIGNAMTRGNPAIEAVLNRKLYYLSLPEILKEFFLRGRHNLVVTATHGKTTATSLLAWIFESADLEPSYLIGGIPANLGQGARLRDSKYFIIEGDEYDTAFFDKRSKFLHYLPELVIVNNIEFDHADIYRDLEEIKTSFRRLLNIVPTEGMVLLNADDPNSVEVAKQCPAPIVEVGFSENAGNQIRNARHQRESPASSYLTPPLKSLDGPFQHTQRRDGGVGSAFYGCRCRKDPERAGSIHGHQASARSPGRSQRDHDHLDDFGHPSSGYSRDSRRPADHYQTLDFGQISNRDRTPRVAPSST